MAMPQSATHETPCLGQRLGHQKSLPESIQLAIGVVALVIFAALWQLHWMSIPVLMAGTLGCTIAVFLSAHRIPALCISLTIYEHGLETMVHGTFNTFTYDKVNSMAAKLTDRLINGEYARTKAHFEFFVDGRLKPYIYEFEFRYGDSRAKLFEQLSEKCRQAIQRRLLAELEREGAVHWRDNASLTAEGIRLTDSVSASRLISYHDIVDWKINCNDLKIWKSGDALPCLVMGIDAPNFEPLFHLFESLIGATRNIDSTCASEPPLAALT
jgi:hypothetical protein